MSRISSTRRGTVIEIEIRRDVNPNKALNYLLKHTNLRTTFGAIMLSLVDGAPRTAPIILMLDQYIKHRKDVILRRTSMNSTVHLKKSTFRKDSNCSTVP
jgi:DNA gyrase subunit A